MLSDIEKIFYIPGDIVRLKHSKLNNVPIMYVVEKVTRMYKHENEVMNTFKGIKCRWFNKNQDLCEAIFSSKDLEKLNK